MKFIFKIKNTIFILIISISINGQNLPLDFDDLPIVKVETINADPSLNPYVLFSQRDFRQNAGGESIYASGLLISDLNYPDYPFLFKQFKIIPECGVSCSRLSNPQVYTTPTGPQLGIAVSRGYVENGTIIEEFRGFILYDENLNPIDSLSAPEIDLHDLAIHPLTGNKLYGVTYIDTLLFPSGLTGFPTDSLFPVEAIRIIEESPAGDTLLLWNASEELQPKDMRWGQVNPSGPIIDWDHWNSAHYDADDNIILSHRHIGLVKIYRPSPTHPNGSTIIFSGKNNAFNQPAPQRTLFQHDFYHFSDGLYYVFSNGNWGSPGGGNKKPATGFVYDINWADSTYSTVQQFRPYGDTLQSIGMGNWHRNEDGSHIFNLGAYQNMPGMPFEDQPLAYYVDANDNVRYEFSFEEGFIFSYRFQSFDTTLFNIQRPQIQCSEENDEIILSTSESYGQYLWSTGETTSTITVQNEGTYFVRVALNDHFGSSSLPLQIDADFNCTLVNAHSNKSKKDIQISPNPSDGQVHFSNIENNSHITIFNELGQNVFEKEFLFNYNKNLTINLQEPPGLYFIKIQNRESGNIQTKKIILF